MAAAVTNASSAIPSFSISGLPSRSGRREKPRRSHAYVAIGRLERLEDSRDVSGCAAPIDLHERLLDVLSPSVRNDGDQMICPEWLPHIQRQFELLARQARSFVRFRKQMLHCPLAGDVEQNEVLLVDIFDMKLDTLAVVMLRVIRLDLDRLWT